jgi:hypothetical protein
LIYGHAAPVRLASPRALSKHPLGSICVHGTRLPSAGECPTAETLGNRCKNRPAVGESKAVMSLDTIAFVIGLLGLLGLIPLAVSAGEWLLDRRRVRRVLRLHNRGHLDVVVTTNHVQPYEAGVAKAYLTAVGEARGIAALSRVLMRHYRKKNVDITVSVDYGGQPTGDVILLGGPLRNEWSRNFLRRLKDNYGVDIEILAEDSRIRIGEFDSGTFDQELEDDIPKRDLGVVILAPWFQNDEHRVVMCAGLSTYGTEAAARFIFVDLPKNKPENRRIARCLRNQQVAVICIYTEIGAGRVQTTAIYKAGDRELITVA